MDAYKIGIVLSLTNNASGVLGLFQKDLAKSEKAAASLEKAMKRIHAATIMAGAAGALGFGLEKALKPAMEYQHQLVLMRDSLNDQVKTGQAVAAAWKTAKDVLTSTPTENLKVLGETKFAFGSLDEAIKNLPQFMKMNAVLASVMGKDGADEAFSAAKLQEIRGSVGNSTEFMRQVDAMVRTAQATQGRVGPDGFLSFGKMAAPFTNRFSDQFLYNEAPTLMQDMNPSRAGTAINTLLQAVVGGRMTKASFATAQGIGLIDKDAKYKVGAAGTIQLEKRQFHGADLAEHDPLMWVRQFLLPAMEGKYGKAHGDDTLLLLTQLLNNRNAQRPAMDFIQNDWRYIKDSAQTIQPRGIKSYDDMLTDDPNTARAAAAAQWDKLWTRLGIDIVPKLVPLIEKLAAGLDRVTGIAERHPEVAKMAFEMGIAVTGVLALTSALLLLSPALTALRVAAFGAGATPGLVGVGVGGAMRAAVPAAVGFGIGHTFGNWWAQNDQAGFGRFKSWMDSWLPNGMKADGAVPPAGGSGAASKGDVYLDKQKVGSVLWSDAAKKMSTPNTGGMSYDPRMSYTPNN